MMKRHYGCQKRDGESASEFAPILQISIQCRHAEESRHRGSKGRQLAEDMRREVYRWQERRAKRSIACTGFADEDTREGIDGKRQKGESPPKDQGKGSINPDGMTQCANELMDERWI